MIMMPLLQQHTQIYDSGATLAEDVDTSETAITVSDGTKFSINDKIQWDGQTDSGVSSEYRETVIIVSISANTLNVIRKQYDSQNNRFINEQNALSGAVIYIVPEPKTIVCGVVPIEYDINTFKNNYESLFPAIGETIDHPAFYLDFPEVATQLFKDKLNALFPYESDEWRARLWNMFSLYTGIN